MKTGNADHHDQRAEPRQDATPTTLALEGQIQEARRDQDVSNHPGPGEVVPQAGRRVAIGAWQDQQQRDTTHQEHKPHVTRETGEALHRSHSL
jgi:hypothetical protein